MSIWFKDYPLEAIKDRMEVNAVKHLGIEISAIGEDFLEGEMEVDHRTQQPLNVLHGGVSCVLVESLGSIAANLVFDPQEFVAVGSSISASHIRPVRNGKVIGRAKPIHLGRTSQIWEIEIKNPAGKMVCHSKLTMAVMENKNKANMNFGL